jgi:hypothetical protein
MYLVLFLWDLLAVLFCVCSTTGTAVLLPVAGHDRHMIVLRLSCSLDVPLFSTGSPGAPGSAGSVGFPSSSVSLSSPGSAYVDYTCSVGLAGCVTSFSCNVFAGSVSSAGSFSTVDSAGSLDSTFFNRAFVSIGSIGTTGSVSLNGSLGYTSSFYYNVGSVGLVGLVGFAVSVGPLYASDS